MRQQIDVRTVRARFTVHRSTSRKAEGHRHDCFSAAEAEAERLLLTDPDGEYIVMREEARITRYRERRA